MNKLPESFSGISPIETHLFQLPDFKSCSHIVSYALEEIFILVSQVSTGLQYSDQDFKWTPVDIIFKNELKTQALPDGFEHKIQDTHTFFGRKKQHYFEGKQNNVQKIKFICNQSSVLHHKSHDFKTSERSDMADNTDKALLPMTTLLHSFRRTTER